MCRAVDAREALARIDAARPPALRRASLAQGTPGDAAVDGSSRSPSIAMRPGVATPEGVRLGSTPVGFALSKMFSVLMLIAALDSPPSNTLTVKDWRAERDGPEKDILDGYVAGTLSGLMWAEAYQRHMGGKRLYCPPETLPQSGKLALSLLDTYVAEHPGSDLYPVSYILLKAVQQTYPCADVAGEKAPAPPTVAKP